MDRIAKFLNSNKVADILKMYKNYYLKENQVALGRWKVDQNTISMERKIDMANYDNCYIRMDFKDDNRK